MDPGSDAAPRHRKKRGRSGAPSKPGISGDLDRKLRRLEMLFEVSEEPFSICSVDDAMVEA